MGILASAHLAGRMRTICRCLLLLVVSYTALASPVQKRDPLPLSGTKDRPALILISNVGACPARFVIHNQSVSDPSIWSQISCIAVYSKLVLKTLFGARHLSDNCTCCLHLASKRPRNAGSRSSMSHPRPSHAEINVGGCTPRPHHLDGLDTICSPGMAGDKRSVPSDFLPRDIQLDRIHLQYGPSSLSIPVHSVVIIDPATSWLVMPQSLLTTLYSLIPDAIPQAAVLGPQGASTPHSIPCSTTLSISFELDGINLSIPTQDLIHGQTYTAHSGMCNSNLHTWVDPDKNSFILGSLFTQTVHVAGNTKDGCFSARQLHKRHSSDSDHAHWRSVIIGGTIGGIAGLAILVAVIYLLFRLRRRRDVPQPTELQPQPSSPVRPPKPPPPVSPPRSPDIPTPAPVASTSQASAHLRLQPVDYGSEARMSTGSQFREHFGDMPPNHARGPKPKSPLGDKPIPPIPFHPLPPAQDGAGPSTSKEPQLSFVPFDGNGARPSERKSSTSPKNSLPPGAASPVESVGSYKPAESHSKEVSI